jgi:dihydrofolate reductase
VGRIIVMNHVTLDGVMQGPARPDEDTRGGFAHSGWGLRIPQASEDVPAAMGERIAAGGGLKGWLFGRWTYEDLMAVWNERGGPFKDALNATPKYVASTTLSEPLRWPNSTLLRGEVVEAVTALKANTDGVLGILGSGQLIASLMPADLVDELLLFIHPLVLGSGRRLFPDGLEATLRLVQGTITSAGVVIASYEPARAGASVAQ